jgi:hypothetical protein
VPITGYMPGLGLSSKALDAATLVWVAAVVAAGGTVSNARRTLVNNLIIGLRADGLWNLLDRLWILAAENTQSALVDMKALVLAVPNGSPAFTANLGYTGVDSSATVYIDTMTNLSNYGGQFTTNSGHASIWSNTNAASTGGGGCTFGSSTASQGNNQTTILPKRVDGNAYFRLDDSTPSGGFANANSTGHYLVNRDSISTTQGYVSGSLFANPNAASGTLANANDIMLAMNDTVLGPVTGGGYQLTMHSIGGNLSGAQVSSFYSRLRTYMTAVGVP